MTPGILTSSCRGLRETPSLHRQGRSRISCLICNGAIMTFGKYFSSKTAVGTLFALNCKALLITIQNTSWLLGRKILIKDGFKALYIPYHSLTPVSPSPAKIQGTAHANVLARDSVFKSWSNCKPDTDNIAYGKCYLCRRTRSLSYNIVKKQIINFIGAKNR
jgi:hypothetical protein